MDSGFWSLESRNLDSCKFNWYVLNIRSPPPATHLMCLTQIDAYYRAIFSRKVLGITESRWSAAEKEGAGNSRHNPG